VSEYKIKKDKEDPITVIIPAAGEGRRMKSYGPKPLIKLDNKTNIIERQIKIISKFFSNIKVVLVAGFKADELMDNTDEGFIKLENQLFMETNVVKSLSLALRSVSSERVLVVYGDLIFNERAIGSLDCSTSCTSASHDPMRKNEVGCIVDHNGNLVNMMYDLDMKWNQILYLHGKELSLFKAECFNRKHSKYFCFEIINKILEKGGRIKCICDTKTKVMDVDVSKDLLYARENIC
jgi:choline kinase